MSAPEAPPRQDLCEACQHPTEAHDVISLRFCKATTAGGFQRGCVCPKPVVKKQK